MCDSQDKIKSVNKEEKIAEKVYATLVEESLEFYKNMFETKDYSNFRDNYWTNAIDLYRTIDRNQKCIFYEILKQVIIDTSATLMGLLEGSSCLVGGGNFESKITFDGVEIQYMQDYFMSFAQKHGTV